MKKIKFGMSVGCLLLVGVLLTVFPVVHASTSGPYTIAQDWTDNWDTALGMHGAYQILPSGIVAPADSEIGNCFTTPTSANLFNVSDAEFKLNGAVGSPAMGQLQALIYTTIGGTQNTTCVPNTSVGLVGFSLGTTPSQIDKTTTGNVTFSFSTLPSQIMLQGGTTYAISIRLSGCSVCNVTNYWKIASDSSKWTLTFRVGGRNVVTSAPASVSPSSPSSFSPYYWNSTNFIPTIQTPITFGYSTTQFIVSGSSPTNQSISVNMNNAQLFFTHLSNSSVTSGITLNYPSSVTTNTGFILSVTSSVNGQFTLIAIVGSQQISQTFTVTVHGGGGGGGGHPK